MKKKTANNATKAQSSTKTAQSTPVAPTAAPTSAPAAAPTTPTAAPAETGGKNNTKKCLCFGACACCGLVILVIIILWILSFAGVLPAVFSPRLLF